MASSSSSSSSSSMATPAKHHVFLSFRGEDTRAKFTSHLHGKLIQKNIETYIDYKIPKGGDISHELIEAIKGSKISAVIFSENYASSSWCLDEVVWILKCKNERGQIVVPIFYEVDPSHVRKQLKSYELAFAGHEERFKQRMDKVDEWRAALKDLASIAGWNSQKYEGTESEFVEAIAKDILEKLKSMHSSSHEFKDLVGINKRIEEVEQLLCIDDSTTVRFIGIWGMGGLGKTTLADVLFKRFSSKFQGCCFLANVRERSKEPFGLRNLYEQLFSKLLGKKDLDTLVPKGKLRYRQVFIVLDDVDDPEQLEVLAAEHDWFGPGSRILVTTRDASVLRERADDHIYELKGLALDDALQLFNLNAFKRNYTSTTDDDVMLCERVVKYANGSPLALKVLGSFLRSKRKEKWEIELKKLKEFPNQRIHNILKISFDTLDETEQDIFLDIVCFFSDQLPACRKLVERRLGAHRSYVDIGIDSLIDKSLITVKDNITLVIHDLLKEMGWEIERQQHIEDPGKRSRFWQEEHLYLVIKNKMGTRSAVEGIYCSNIGTERDWSPTMFNGMHWLWLLDVSWSHDLYSPEGFEYLPASLKCLIWNFWPWKSLPSNFLPHNLVELRMPCSKLKKLWSGVVIPGNLKFVDLNSSCSLNDISALSQAPNLVSVDLTGCSSLHQVPPLRFRVCDELTSLDHSSDRCSDTACQTLGCLRLGFCTHLEVVEKISGNLKELSLSFSSIKELPSSILSLDNLEYLNLSYCHNLKSLPSDIEKLKSLRRLNLTKCLSIDKLPVLPGNLIELDLSETALEEVPSSSIEHLSILEKLSLSRCRRLKSLPIGIFKLKCLKRLELGVCDPLEITPVVSEHLETLSSQEIARIQGVPSLWFFNFSKILDEICCLSSLEKLRLDGRNIEGIPVNVKNLSKLIELVIRHCKRLKSLPELPSSLELLDVSECTSLEMISNSRDTLEQGFKSGNHVMTYRTFSYVNCFRLDQNTRNNIVTEFQLRALDTGFKSVLPHSIFQKSDCTPGVGICCPGNVIPMWFTHQSKSSSLKVELPSNWWNTDFLGFALCAVIVNPYFIHNLSCQGKFETKNGTSWTYRWDFHHVDPVQFESSNMFMWYEYGNYHNCLDAVEVSFSFSETVNSPEYWIQNQVRACGIRLVYIQDAEELGITNNLGISNGVLKTGAVNSDIDDQRSIRKTSEPSRSSNEADLGEKLVTTSGTDGSGEALAEEADELGGFGKESVTGLAGMGHRHMDYDNVQTATGGVDRQRRRTVGALGSRRWTCWCIGKKKEAEEG